MIERLLLFWVISIGIYSPTKADTIVVFDCSGSMQGDNLDVAKEECRDLVTSIKIDDENPFLLIPFDSVAKPPIACTTEQDAIQAIDQLNVTGGTSIAAGLNAASDEIERLGDDAALVVLVSDGVDNDTEGRSRAEQRLGQLLKHRDASGAPTRMIVKRWGGETLSVVSNLQAYSANVLDVGSATIESLLWIPEVTILTNERKPNNASQLVELEVRLPAEGFAKPRDINVTSPSPATLATSLVLRPGETKTGTLELPLELEDINRGTQDVVLDFEIAGTEATLNTVVRTVPVPPIRQIASFEATLSSASFLRWKSPESNRVVGVADIEVKFSPIDSSTVGMPVRFEFAPSSNLTLLSPQQTIFHGLVGDTIPLLLEFEARSDAKDMALEIIGFDEARDGKFELGQNRLEFTGLELPPAERTPVRFTVKRVETPIWTDLRERKVQTKVWIDVFVDGYIPGKNTVVCAGPGRIRWEPDTFTTGHQEVSLLVETTADMDGGSKELAFFFSVRSDNNEAIVLDVPTEPVLVTMPAPGRIQVVLLDEYGQQLENAEVFAKNGETSLTVYPVLSGRLTEDAANGAGLVRIQQADQTFESGLSPIDLSLRSTEPPRFLFERSTDIGVVISLPAAGELVVPARLDIVVKQPAVLSLWLARYAPWILGFLIVIGLVGAVLFVKRRDRSHEFSIENGDISDPNAAFSYDISSKAKQQLD